MKEDPGSGHSEDMMVKYGFTYAHDCVGNLSEDVEILLYVLRTLSVWLTFPDRWWLEVHWRIRIQLSLSSR